MSATRSPGKASKLDSELYKVPGRTVKMRMRSDARHRCTAWQLGKLLVQLSSVPRVQFTHPRQVTGLTHPLGAGGDEDEDEVDPLDAFMADNKAAVAAAVPRPKAEVKPEPEEQDEDDPLEAFMKTQIEPAVKQMPAADLKPMADQKQPLDQKPAVPLVKTGVLSF